MIKLASWPVSVLPRVGRWLIVLAGLAAIAVGGYLLELHGQGTCGVVDEQCPKLYNTWALGLVVLGSGTVALVATLRARAVRTRAGT